MSTFVSSGPTVAVVGATGAVGREMLAVLEQRRFPMRALRVFASPRSAGSTLPFRGTSLTVEALTDAWPAGIDCALLAAGSGISKAMGPKMVASGTVVIDNSSAFRMDPNVALIVPEINMHADRAGSGAGSATRPGRIIANPNCSTIILLMAVTPLHRAFGIERMVVSTYQAASGAGWQAMEALERETRDALAGAAPKATLFAEPYAFNLFSHNSAVDPATGMNVEEQKMLAETHKIWNDPNIRISATCVRVPVMRAHCESVNITLRTPATLADIRRTLADAAADPNYGGIRIIDDRAANAFPTPLKAGGGDDVLIGRLRVDPSQLPANPHTPPTAPALDATPTRGFDMFIAGDQLRKGAAQNAVQIAERIFTPR
jgi:aspartate-semialdehyde dehydrogenase